MDVNDITGAIIGAAMTVHRQLGPGLLASAYKECLCYELRERGLTVQREKPVPVIYKGCALDCGYRVDLIVNERVIVEVKSVDKINDVHLAQMLTYMKLTGRDYGLLLNFNVVLLKEGIRRLTTRSSSVTSVTSVVKNSVL